MLDAGTLYIDYNSNVGLDMYISHKAKCDAIFCKENGLKIDIVLSHLPHVYILEDVIMAPLYTMPNAVTHNRQSCLR